MASMVMNRDVCPLGRMNNSSGRTLRILVRSRLGSFCGEGGIVVMLAWGVMCGRRREKENREGGPGGRSCEYHWVPRVWETGPLSKPPPRPDSLLPLLSFLLLPNLYS